MSPMCFISSKLIKEITKTVTLTISIGTNLFERDESVYENKQNVKFFSSQHTQHNLKFQNETTYIDCPKIQKSNTLELWQKQRIFTKLNLRQHGSVVKS